MALRETNSDDQSMPKKAAPRRILACVTRFGCRFPLMISLSVTLLVVLIVTIIALSGTQGGA